MGSTTIQSRGASRARGEERAVSSDALDQGVEAYFSDLDRETLMDAEQERLAAERILRLRREYWNRLLGYPPFLDAMLSLVQEALAARGRKSKLLPRMQRAAEVLHGRPRQDERVRAEAVQAAFAEELADLDPSIEIADRLFADLESIDAGQSREAGLGVRAPARGSATFRRYLHGVRSARMALCAARHELVRANLRLVVTMAHRYRRNGRLPLLGRMGFKGPIHATPATIEMSALILRDSARLQLSETERANRKRQRKTDLSGICCPLPNESPGDSLNVPESLHSTLPTTPAERVQSQFLAIRSWEQLFLDPAKRHRHAMDAPTTLAEKIELGSEDREPLASQHGVDPRTMFG